MSDQDYLIKLNKPFSFLQNFNHGSDPPTDSNDPPPAPPEPAIDFANLTAQQIAEILQPLDQLIGMQHIKGEIRSLIDLMIVRARRLKAGLPAPDLSLHMVFTGHPGTGKTTIARLLGQIFKDMGVLKRGHVVEVDRSQLVGEYIGQTERITRDAIANAMNGILFVDEAHMLNIAGSYNDFGPEAVATIMKAMEDFRDLFIVIFAGPGEDIQWLLNRHEGLASRFANRFDFPDFTAEELAQIMDMFFCENGYVMEKKARKALADQIASDIKSGFLWKGNARDCRNMFERIVKKQAARIVSENLSGKAQMSKILIADLPFVIEKGKPTHLKIVKNKRQKK